MSHWRPDYFDPHYINEEDQADRKANPLRPRSCRYCGQRGLHWEELDPGEWKLVDTKTGEIHHCPPAPAGTFNDLT